MASRQDEDMNEYGLCALVIKDRLLNITIRERIITEEEGENTQIAGNYGSFYRLYNALHKFQKVELLSLTMLNGNIIDVLEKITDDCPSLKQVNTKIMNNEQATAYSIDQDMLSTIIPVTNIKKLKIRGNLLVHLAQLFHYIMTKFTEIDVLDIDDKPSNSSYIERFLVIKIISYNSRIQVYSIYDWNCSENLIGYMWKSLAETYTLSVKGS